MSSVKHFGSSDPEAVLPCRVDGRRRKGRAQRRRPDRLGYTAAEPSERRTSQGGAKMDAVETTRTLEEKRLKEVKQPILTAIDEPVVVGLVGLGAVTPLLEVDGGDALGATGGVVVESDIAKRADGGVEQVL